MELNFKKVLIIFAGLAGCSLAESRLPNIVYIICDDLGYGEIQCLNPERGKVPTPHIDQLAKQGMVFTDAHSGSSVCTPTRYGVLTGRYAWRTHLQRGVLSHDSSLISEGRLTVPALLKEAGYHTACIGKWHLGMTYTDADGAPIKVPASKERYGAPIGSQVVGSPVEHGFDYYYGFSYARSMRSMIENKAVVKDLDLDKNLDELATQAEQYIAKQAQTDAPFFLYVALGAPHTPIAPSKDWIGKSGMGDYCDFVMETDYSAGRVIKALEDHGITENTLVFFTSDNGCSAGPAKAAKLIEQYGHYPSAHLRGYKSDAWEGGHRVPFIVRWPGKISAGTHNNRVICHTDLMATCAEIAGQKIAENAGEDSFTILPLLRDPTAAAPRDSVIHHSITGKFSIRQGKWKLVMAPGSGGWSKPKDDAARAEGLPAMQLYDLETDLGETNNRINDYPEKRQALLVLLSEQVENGRSTPGSPLKNDVPVKMDKHGKTKHEKVR